MVCAFVNMVGLYTGGLIFRWAYIWNGVSGSKYRELMHGWGATEVYGILVFGIQ